VADMAVAELQVCLQTVAEYHSLRSPGHAPEGSACSGVVNEAAFGGCWPVHSTLNPGRQMSTPGVRRATLSASASAGSIATHIPCPQAGVGEVAVERECPQRRSAGGSTCASARKGRTFNPWLEENERGLRGSSRNACARIRRNLRPQRLQPMDLSDQRRWALVRKRHTVRRRRKRGGSFHSSKNNPPRLIATAGPGAVLSAALTSTWWANLLVRPV